MTIRSEIKDLAPEMIGLRRELHAQPGLSYEEIFASRLVEEKLTAWNIEHETGWAGGTGIVATIKSSQNSGKNAQDSGRVIGLRADMDALPILERSGVPWASTNDGVMHACGHDGHTAILLTAAKYLSQHREAFNGTVKLIFQPAEEGKGGAAKMIEEGLFTRHKMDSVFALHNWPNIPKGKIAVHDGAVMAASDRFNITIIGRSGHGALPHLANNPINIAGTIIGELNTIVGREKNPMDPGVISLGHIYAGAKGGHAAIPDTALLQGTVRSCTKETRARLQERITKVVQGLVSAFDAVAEIEYFHVHDATINDPDEAAICRRVAGDILGQEQVLNIPPEMTAEDFGFMLQQVPGAYVWLGQGDPDDKESIHNCSLHNAGYDFDDDVLTTGAEYFVRLVEDKLEPSP